MDYYAHLPQSSGDVAVREFVITDISEDYIGWLNDPEVVKYSNQRFREHDEASAQTYYVGIKKSDSLFLAITREEKMVGTMSVHFSPHHSTADIGIMLGDRNVWGKGLGRTAWGIVMEFLLDQGVRKVTGGTLRCNKGMVNIMESTGMVPDGLRVAQELVDGVAEDIVHYAKFS